MRRRRNLLVATAILATVAGVSALLAAAGAVIESIEIGVTTGTIGLTTNSTLKLGDNTNDAVHLQSGSGDPVTASVDGGTPALRLSGSPSPGASLAGIVTFDHQSRTRWSLTAPQIVAPGAWVPIEFNFDPTFTSPDHFDEHIESMPGSPGAPWIFTAAEEGYYQVNSRTEVLFEEQTPDAPVGPVIAAAATPPGPGAVSIAIFKNGSIHSQGNNLQMFALTLAGGGPTDPPHQHELPLQWNNAPNVADVVYLKPGEFIDIRVWVGAGTPPPGFTAALLAETQATYVSVHKLS